MTSKLSIQQVKIGDLKPAEHNPRKWGDEAIQQLKDSIKSFGLVGPILANGAKERKNVVIGGHFRLKVAKDLGYKEVPVVYLVIPDIEREKELNIRPNKNLGEFVYELPAKFDKSLLTGIGFDSEEIEKLDINKITVKKGDIYQLVRECIFPKVLAKYGSLLWLGRQDGGLRPFSLVRKEYASGAFFTSLCYTEPVALRLRFGF
jgi:hypothetical protein